MMLKYILNIKNHPQVMKLLEHNIYFSKKMNQIGEKDVFIQIIYVI